MKVLCAFDGCENRVVWPKGWAGASLFCATHTREHEEHLEALETREADPALAAGVFERAKRIGTGDDPYAWGNGKGMRRPR